MKLKEVKIHNFRNIDHKVLEVDEHATIISGENMSGKTNTLNAIHWAFTGKTLDGSNDNRANFPIDCGGLTAYYVEVLFDTFGFARVCEMVNGTPTVSIHINGEVQKTVKVGEAQLHKALGLTDFVLTQPRGFDIIQFLLNPLYFEKVAPKSLRQFFYKLCDVDFEKVANKQNKTVYEAIQCYGKTDPYELLEIVAKEKAKVKKVITWCDDTFKIAPEIDKGLVQIRLEKANKELKLIENQEALLQKYALAVSKEVNKYYQKAMDIKVCLLEPGVGDDVFLDVCYPILPVSNLPFSQGSYAEKTRIAVSFVSLIAAKYNIPTLPLLIDNYESLDEFSKTALYNFIEAYSAQYIAAKVQY